MQVKVEYDGDGMVESIGLPLSIAAMSSFEVRSSFTRAHVSPS